MSILSNNIQLIRGIANLKQDEFADVVVPKDENAKDKKKEIKNRRALISSYESGVAVPKLIVLMNIAKFAGVQTEDLSTRSLSVNEISINSEKTNGSYPNKVKVSQDLNEYLRINAERVAANTATLRVLVAKIKKIESLVLDKPFDQISLDFDELERAAAKQTLSEWKSELES